MIDTDVGTTGSHGLLVLLPDARIRGVLPPLAARLAEAGCEILAVAPMDLTSAVVAQLYRHNFGRQEPGRVDGTWLGRRTFTLDQSVVLVLRSQVITDLPRALARWKGSSAPTGRTAGSLRSVAGFANRCMSLLHTSDDHAQTSDDVGLLLGAELRDAVLGDAPDRPIAWADVIRLAERAGPDVDLTPQRFLAGVLARALLVLGLDARLTPTRSGPDPLPTVAAALVAGRRNRSDLVGLERPDLRVVPKDAVEAALARRLLRHRRDLVDVVELIAEGRGGGRLAEYADEVLTANGVVNDAWERHMLLTTLTFPVSGHG